MNENIPHNPNPDEFNLVSQALQALYNKPIPPRCPQVISGLVKVWVSRQSIWADGPNAHLIRTVRCNESNCSLDCPLRRESLVFEKIPLIPNPFA